MGLPNKDLISAGKKATEIVKRGLEGIQSSGTKSNPQKDSRKLSKPSQV